MGESFAGPVVLATLGDRPFDPAAVEAAVDIAGEHGTWLAIVDLVEAPLAGRSGPRDLGPPPATTASLEAAVERARAADVPVTVMRGLSFHPPATLVALVLEQRACLLVFGPEPSVRRLARWRHRRLVRLLERRTSCLLWSADLAPGGAARRAAFTVACVARQWPVASRRPW